MKNTSVLKKAKSQRLKPLIFTDLDGSLLDHYSYSFSAAQPLLKQLNELDIPVICTTSKTFAELEVLRSQLNNTHPFIVENGAAVYIPRNYFPADGIVYPFKPSVHGGYQCYAFSQSRSYWTDLLTTLKEEFGELFVSFSDLGVDGICAATNLKPAAAALANEREFSEPVQWLGDEQAGQAFIKRLIDLGATVLQGGRFLHVSGASDKGRALQWLASIYQQRGDVFIESIAVGDSSNDIPMLEIADKALVIRSPVHPPLELKREGDYWLSNKPGPAGWAQGIRDILGLTEENQ